MGRLDDQVKIRGNRVELAEVEEALHAQAGVSEAVVLASETEGGGERQLLAFIVPDGQQAPPEAELRRGMLETLPDYMAPSAILPLDALPLNANGKTDKQALLQRYRQLTGKTDNDVQEHPPEATYASQTERDIADAWARVLEHSRFGRTDRFFDVGGHSLLAARLMQDVRERLSVQVWIRDLFEHDTVASLARLLDERRRNDQPGPRWTGSGSIPCAKMPAYPTIWCSRRGRRRIHWCGLVTFCSLVSPASSAPICWPTCWPPPRRACTARYVRSGVDPWRRLDETLTRYGITLSKADRERVEMYRADLSEPWLGLTEMHYDELAEAVDVIYHSASAVNFIQPYSYMKRDNVQGLLELLRFAAARRTKPLMLLSTISVYSWGHLHTGKRVMYEDDDIDQNLDAVITDIGYVRSKWVMERWPTRQPSVACR